LYLFHENFVNNTFSIILNVINLNGFFFSLQLVNRLNDLCDCNILLQMLYITKFLIFYLKICFRQRGHYLFGALVKHSRQNVCPQWMVTGTAKSITQIEHLISSYRSSIICKLLLIYFERAFNVIFPIKFLLNLIFNKILKTTYLCLYYQFKYSNIKYMMFIDTF
jgi:hypothetical protein